MSDKMFFFVMSEKTKNSVEKSIISSPFWRWKKRMETTKGIIVDVISQNDLMLYDEKQNKVLFLDPEKDNVEIVLSETTTNEVLELVREKRKDYSWRPYSISYDGVTYEYLLEKPSHKRQTIYASFKSAVISEFLMLESRLAEKGEKTM